MTWIGAMWYDLLALLINKPETVALVVNILTFLVFVVRGGEPYKAIYWFGAILITVGLLGMKG